MEYIQTTIAQDFGFTDEETMLSLNECFRKLNVYASAISLRILFL